MMYTRMRWRIFQNNSRFIIIIQSRFTESALFLCIYIKNRTKYILDRLYIAGTYELNVQDCFLQ
jgi:hypothetical protein